MSESTMTLHHHNNYLISNTSSAINITEILHIMCRHVYCIPWIWLSITTMVVDATSSVCDLTSRQVICVPLWLLPTALISSLDDTGLPSAEFLVKLYVVALSISWNVCASAGSSAVMAHIYSLKTWTSSTMGKFHSRSVPVTLHVNSSSSPTQPWAIPEGDSITAPETEFPQFFFTSYNSRNYVLPCMILFL